MVISTAQQQELAYEVKDLIKDLCVYVYAKAIQHVPIETVDESLRIVDELRVDGLIAVGGGSSIGLAKAISLKTSLPILAIPTTYAGSEMTPIWGVTENGIKKTGKNMVVKPKTVIYDPNLTVSLPPSFTVTSGMNSIAHCVEGLYAENANPITSLLAEEGIRAISTSLPKIVNNPYDLDARSVALYGAMIGGTVLGTVGMALHHKLCHTLGGIFNLPHAETHTVILPYVIEYNAEYAVEAIKSMARALNSTEDNVSSTIFDIAYKLGAPTSLSELGLEENDLDKAAEIATKNPYYNPRPIDKVSIRQLLQFAFEGIRPEKGMFRF